MWSPIRAGLDFTLGPVMLNPTIELTNLGVDTNVFNAPVGQEKSDFTFTLSPKSDIWMRVGRIWVTGNVREDIPVVPDV